MRPASRLVWIPGVLVCVMTGMWVVIKLGGRARHTPPLVNREGPPFGGKVWARETNLGELVSGCEKWDRTWLLISPSWAFVRGCDN